MRAPHHFVLLWALSGYRAAPEEQLNIPGIPGTLYKSTIHLSTSLYRRRLCAVISHESRGRAGEVATAHPR
jgi:hypothetical protein